MTIIEIPAGHFADTIMLKNWLRRCGVPANGFDFTALDSSKYPAWDVRVLPDCAKAVREALALYYNDR